MFIELIIAFKSNQLCQPGYLLVDMDILKIETLYCLLFGFYQSNSRCRNKILVVTKSSDFGGAVSGVSNKERVIDV